MIQDDIEASNGVMNIIKTVMIP
ncbi:MAG: hypothetical protein GQ576_01920 [Methanococcoides sp.]|nr:hypothetical protein [Methanococcoides sp.]